MNMQIFSMFGRIMLEGGEKAEQQLDRLDATGKRTGTMFTNLGKVALGVGAAAGALGGALFALVNRVTATGDALNATSQQLGVSTDALQEYRYASDQLGISQDTMERALGRLNQRMGMAAEGNEKYAVAMERLGITADNTEDAFMQVVESLHQVEDAQTRAALAGELLGTNTARQLMPAIEAGGEALLNLRNRAHELGVVMSGDAIDASSRYQSALTDLKAAFGGIVQELAVRVLPVFESFVGWVAEHLPKVGAVVQFVGEIIEIVFRYIGLIVGDTITFLRETIIDPFVNWLAGIWAERGPPIVAAVSELWEGVVDIFSQVWDNILGLWEVFSLGFEGDWKGAWDRLTGIFRDTWNAIPDLFNGIWEPLVAIADGIMQAVIDVIRDVFGDDIGDHFEGVWNTVLDVFDLFQETFLGVWRALSAVFSGDWETAWNETKDVFSRIWGALPGIIDGVLTGAFGIVDTLVNSIINVIREVFGDGVADVFETAWDAVTIVFETARTTILNILQTLTSVFKGDWEQAWADVKKIFSDVWDGLAELYQGPLNGVVRWIHGWVIQIRDWFGAMRDLVTRSVQMTVAGIVEWFSDSKLGKTFSWLKDMVEGATGFFADMWDDVVGNSYVPDMVEGIGESIAELDDKMVTPVGKFTAQVGQHFADMGEEVTGAYDRMVERWSTPFALHTPDGIGVSPGEQIAEVTDNFTDAIDKFVDGLLGVLTPMGLLGSILNHINVGGTILGGLFDALEPIIASLQHPLELIGNIMGTVLAPVLQALEPILVGFGVVASYVAEFVAGAWNALASVINLIPFVSVAKIDTKAIRDARKRMTDGVDSGYTDREFNDPDFGGGSRPSGGRQVAQITGPTRDLLIDLLSPIANLGTLTGIGERIYNLLDARLVPSGMGMAGVGVSATAGGVNVTIGPGAVQIMGGSGGTSEISRETIEEIGQQLAEQIAFQLRGQGQ